MRGFCVREANPPESNCSLGVGADAGDPVACPLELLKEALQAPAAKGRSGKSKATPQARSRRMVMVILDEIDQLVSQDQAVLYELFALPQVMPILPLDAAASG